MTLATESPGITFNQLNDLEVRRWNTSQKCEALLVLLDCLRDYGWDKGERDNIMRVMCMVITEAIEELRALEREIEKLPRYSAEGGAA